VGKTSDPYLDRIEQAAKVERGRVSLDGGVGRQDYLGNAAVSESMEQFAYSEGIGGDPVEGGDCAVEDMIAASILPRAFEGEDILWVLDHTDHRLIPSGGDAQSALLGDAKGRTHGALTDAALEIVERGGQLAHRALRCSEHPVDEACSRFLADAREAPKLLNGSLNGIGCAHL